MNGEVSKHSGSFSFAVENSLKMNKSFKYRLQPTEEQAVQLGQIVGCTRFVYNWGLQRWKEQYLLGLKPTAYSLMLDLVFLKKEEDKLWLNDCIAQVLQQSLSNLGTAFTNFFKKRTGYPQFKKKGIRDSFRIPQKFGLFEDTKEIKLLKIGLIKYIQDRPIQGIPKHLTISRIANHWYVSVCCEMDDVKQVNINTSIVGIDAGVANLFTTYDGEKSVFYHHQSRLKKLHTRLKIVQKQFFHKLKGSKNRDKIKLRLQRIYEQIRHVRLDTLHKLSTHLAKNHGAVVIEVLKINYMTKSASGTIDKPGKNVSQKRSLNRVIMEQAWGTLFRQLAYKCSWYGSILCLGDPAYTSQMCPKCFHASKENRKTQAKFSCVNCGLTLRADVIAAMNLRAQALPA